MVMDIGFICVLFAQNGLDGMMNRVGLEVIKCLKKSQTRLNFIVQLNAKTMNQKLAKKAELASVARNIINHIRFRPYYGVDIVVNGKKKEIILNQN